MIYDIVELREEIIARLGDTKRMRLLREESRSGDSYRKVTLTLYIRDGELRQDYLSRTFYTFRNAPHGPSFRDFGKEVLDSDLSNWYGEIRLSLDMADDEQA